MRNPPRWDSYDQRDKDEFEARNLDVLDVLDEKIEDDDPDWVLLLI